MTAFLRHLVQRSVASPSGLQPRLPSRFENSTGGLRPEPTLSEETAERSASATPIAPASRPAPASARSAPSSAEKMAPPPASLAPVRPAASVVPSLRVDTHSQHLPVANAPVNAAPEPRRPAIDLPSPERPLAPAPAPVTPAREELLLRPTTLLREHVVEHTREFHHEIQTRIAPPPATEGPAPALPLQIAPMQPVAPRVDAPLPAPGLGATPPAPMIHVTIGRIDITALPPSSAPSVSRPAPPAARPPRTSLEDYLKQRSHA